MRVFSSPFLPINCMDVGRPFSVNPFSRVIEGCPEKLVWSKFRTHGVSFRHFGNKWSALGV